MARGDIILSILEGISEIGGTTSDFLDAFLEAGYGASLHRIEYLARRAENERTKQKRQDELIYQERQRYYSFIYQLKKDGLVQTDSPKRGGILNLTKEGLIKMHWLRRRSKETSVMPIKYEKLPSQETVIVLFDVPENESFKRRWLRRSLKSMGFKMLQKSAWIGRIKLPPEFLEDIDKLKIAQYLEVLVVAKAGSLRRLKL